VTDDFPHETANNDAAISKLQDTLRELQAQKASRIYLGDCNSGDESH
jgi:hypothetical protein